MSAESFQLTAARRRLGRSLQSWIRYRAFQLTAARRRLGNGFGAAFVLIEFQLTAARRRLVSADMSTTGLYWFQLTAARRRLVSISYEPLCRLAVSTHSRPKAAGKRIMKRTLSKKVSTHSRPKAAGDSSGSPISWQASFNSQPPEGGWLCCLVNNPPIKSFQLTAARRRLVGVCVGQ